LQKKARRYKHLFFDLDCTLWDYLLNSTEALSEIFKSYKLQEITSDFEKFKRSFHIHNEAVWKEYREGRIQKDTLRILRFERTLEDLGITDYNLARKLNSDFVNISPRKTKLIPGTMEVLRYLKDKNYKMYIITNGFMQIQELKISVSGLSDYFIKIFTPENIGYIKPHRAIFEYAVKSVNAHKTESIMIGDDLEMDIIGAREFGIDQIYFNPHAKNHNEKITYEIASLYELKNLL
jgi:putative hydrolase of the HAD superfamily